MVKSYAIREKAGTVVFQSLSVNLAAVVCAQLEGAGLPACLGKVDGGFAVMVPSEDAAQSRNLLTGRPMKCEIFLS